MRHIIFAEASSYTVAVLTKTSSFNKMELQRNYVTPLNSLGVVSSDIIGFSLKYDDTGKAPVKFIKEYLGNLLPALDNLKTQYLYVCDSNYFKVLAGVTKSEPHHGYCLPCKVKGFEHMKVVLGLNYQALIYNPDLQSKLDMSLSTLAQSIQGTHTQLGTNIIHSAQYPESLADIAAALESLLQYPELTCDIEGFSLDFEKCGIGTIAFAWDQHNGVAFPCDYRDSAQYHRMQLLIDPLAPEPEFHGFQLPNPTVRALLKSFFERYKGKLIFHNATFDAKVIIYYLWMQNLLDNDGLLTGLHLMCRDFDDTKIIAYLATNSTAGNILGLKYLAHEFAGNYAQEDIKDIRKIPQDKLLEYNLVDCLSTWYVRNKYYPIMVADQQEHIYKTLMLPSQKVITQIELTGMPLDQKIVAKVKAELEAKREEHLKVILGNPVIKTLNLIVQTKAMEDANAKLKTKQHPLEKFADKAFNPNSGPQLQVLLYELMGLPVIDKTDSGKPSTGADTLDKLINHTTQPSYKAILEALIGYGKINKILTSFIPAFELAINKGDGITYLHGSFNLGGTVSGRLSSSDPNLQNIPAGSIFGKLIKMCFRAAAGWLFCGADFNSLEDYISALTTKDPNKLKVYLEGYDGHCLRAFSYFPEKLPGIVDTVESINSIKKLFEDVRQESKAPTFALTYQGTWHTLVNNLGFDKDTAQKIEANYHDLYKVSDEWVQKRLEQASKDGYVELAFGLRLRTPLLAQTLMGTSNRPYEAAAEGRTAGNAMGQSYGLLNNRAINEFMEKVWASEYRNDIKPVALIHDAIYLLIKDDLDVIEWANRELIKCMQWQELPELVHDKVKLGAALDIFWPDWSKAVTLPNNADKATIAKLCKKHAEKLKEAA